jgi:predicted nuclease of predicted toxin-antitoxin system
MRFLLDENFPKRAIPLLEAAGHECFDARGVVPEGSDDDLLFSVAQEHQAVFLTTDKDFFHTVPMRASGHCGAIIIALSQPNGTAILARLTDALAHVQERGIAGRALLLTDHRSYLR